MLQASPRAGQTALYYSGFVVLGLLDGGIGPSLSTFAGSAGVTLAEIAACVAAAALGRLSGSVIAGRLYGRVNGHLALAVGFALTAAASGAITFLPGLLALVAGSYLLGLFSSTVDVGSNTMIQWTHGDRVGPYMNGLHLAFGGGGALAPVVIATSLAATGQVRFAWLGIAALNVAMMVAALLIRPPSPPPVHSAAGLSRVKALPLALIGGAFFAYAGCEITMVTWAADYGVAIGLERTGAATVFATTYWLSFMVGRLLAIPATHRFPLRSVTGAAFVLSAAAGLAFVLSGGASPWLWLAVCGVGVGIAPIFPNAVAFAGARLGATAGITGYVFVLASLGALLWPWVAGQLFETTRGAIVPWMVFGFSVATGLLFWAFDRATRPAA